MALYSQPHQFTPLLPSAAMLEPLLDKASDLVKAAATAGRPPIPLALQQLLRAMNSYYTNRIEGQHTRPAEIDQALRQDFSADRDLARRQHLAIAHMQAEAQLQATYATPQDYPALWTPDAPQHIHRALFQPLPQADRVSDDGLPFSPGEWRTRDVEVGQHVAPAHAAVPAFLAHWAQVYASARRGELTLVAIAASHHRLAWVHPFLDGNGRMARLHTHLALHALGYTGGLWSPLRGFARQHRRYYQLLQAADEPRRGDLDGRGNLSESALVAWIDFVLDTCIDQARFMAERLQMATMLDRIKACLAFEEHMKTGVRMEAAIPLHYLLQTGGDMERGAFKDLMGGLGERTAQTVLGALLSRELLTSDSARGRVRFGVPLHALRFYFPALWPEAEADG
ncbi:Fic family protein [Ideonella alba]|uniref:Fic family protein n=1 Tax=Ideonella alba TaxID=2824118 RepID=UPI0028731EE1|nr:Fic family protein [Ideonella alba]